MAPWTKALVGALVVLLASTTWVFAAQHMENKGANAIIGTVDLVDAETGIVWLEAENNARIKMVAPPEEQLQGLEVGDRIEVRLEKQRAASASENLPDQTVAGTLREVDEASGLLRMETTRGNIIDIGSPKGLASGMEAGDRVQLTIHKKSQKQSSQQDHGLKQKQAADR
jgi:hypothetical protein